MFRRPFLALLIFSGLALRAAETAPHILIWIGEDEYKTKLTLPAFAKSDLHPQGWRTTIVSEPENQKGEFPGLIAAIPDADLILLSVRRRSIPSEALTLLRKHLDSGKPLVGIRTASHAFAPKEPLEPDKASWPEFDKKVLGGNYQNHFGKGPLTKLEQTADHPINEGIDFSKLTGMGSLYRNDPLPKTSFLLVNGMIPGEKPQPVAWINRYGPAKARIFYTSLGDEGDFQQAAFRQWLRQAIDWCLQKTEP